MTLHQNHRLLIGLSAGLYLLLSIVIAVLPAFEAQRAQALPGIVVPTDSVSRGRDLYLKEGCGVCHTQFVRNLPLDRPYGRGSHPGDYALEDPPLLGTQRTGPDLSNIGKRQPSEVWNLIHLYNPRAVVSTSVMPGYPWLFTEKEQKSQNEQVVPVPPEFNPQGKVIVATTDAIDLVHYLQLLQQADVVE